MQGRPARQFAKNRGDRFPRALFLPDGPHQEADGSVNRDVETARGQSRCRIIGEQQRARMIDGHAQRLHFTVVQRQESGERQKFRGCRSAGRGVAPRESGLVQGCGAVPLGSHSGG